VVLQVTPAAAVVEEVCLCHLTVVSAHLLLVQQATLAAGLVGQWPAAANCPAHQQQQLLLLAVPVASAWLLYL
jgi:hypothetical protein